MTSMTHMILPSTRPFVRALGFRHFAGERLLRSIRSIMHFVTEMPAFRNIH